ncbi:glucoamylase-like protein [Trypanosoma conorhini]|uniref:Glucoamylase-like protein n=1 Tax=Trypanosoma conorhini TaxID=83891 RepID=A0A3R7LDU8_9TRYP|nr:glucoamylase-like protein [Trypanosoma conorhini]RNF26420.1 glucoamylase-like protein [Trypanosoma conorhini]
MPGASSPTATATAAADCLLGENSLRHQRSRNAAVRRHTPSTAPQSSQNDHHHHHHHHYHYHYQHQRHHQQLQQQQNENLLAHMTPANAQFVPLLPPRIHSILYHRFVGHTAESSSSQWHGAQVVPAGGSLPFPATCLRTPSGPGRQLQSHATCNFPATVPANRRASTFSEEAGAMPVRVTVITPSPYSENASLGNGSVSPATTRGCQTTETKRRLYTSPMMYSPGVSPSRGIGHSSVELTGRALEKELRAAEKDDLLQVLLELSSCNQEAACFIQSKASLFSLRRATMSGRKQGENTDSAPASEAAATTTNTAASVPDKAPERLPKGVSFGILDRCCDSTHVTPSKPLTFEADTSLSNSCEKFTSAGGASPANLSSRDTASMQVRLLTPSKQSVVQEGGEKKRTSAQGVLAEACVKAEDRPWCNEVHPCLRWYRSCRHPTSCPFASMPQNLCLNWVRGSCMLGAECSGVHRLPDTCPSDVLTLFELCHGADRAAVAHEKLQPQLLQQQQQQQLHPNCIPTHAVCAVPNLQRCEGPSTPVVQIISDYGGMPASLEHHYHELRHWHQETALPSQEQQGEDGNCRCRSCRTPSTEFDSPGRGREEQLWEQSQYSPPTAAQPVSRCLDASFTAAECLENTIAGEVTSTPSWRESASNSTLQIVAACGAWDEEEGTEFFPLQHTRTRTQSPVVP